MLSIRGGALHGAADGDRKKGMSFAQGGPPPNRYSVLPTAVRLCRPRDGGVSPLPASAATGKVCSWSEALPAPLPPAPPTGVRRMMDPVQRWVCSQMWSPIATAWDREVGSSWPPCTSRRAHEACVRECTTAAHAIWVPATMHQQQHNFVQACQFSGRSSQLLHPSAITGAVDCTEFLQLVKLSAAVLISAVLCSTHITLACLQASSAIAG